MLDSQVLQDKQIGAVLKVHDGVPSDERTRALEDEAVGIGATPQDVASRVAKKGISPRVTAKRVVSFCGNDQVVAETAIKDVVAGFARQDIVAGIPECQIVAGARGNPIGPLPPRASSMPPSESSTSFPSPPSR